jgi:3-keto-L-gulonate-6-phosphate decarboxylase
LVGEWSEVAHLGLLGELRSLERDRFVIADLKSLDVGKTEVEASRS